jgi:UDP-N-acetylmuramoyl-L-alanyl-D-glutamate--2,6-diaminopimelate ligase
MGLVAGRDADVAIVTSDNPRNEDPDAIIDDVMAGVPDGSEVHVRRQRAEAIDLVIDLARPGDVVVVAGKGHEREIEIGTQRVPFADAEVVAAAVTAKARRTATTGPGTAS